MEFFLKKLTAKKSSYVYLNQGSIHSDDINTTCRLNNVGSSYRWWSKRASLIVDDPDLAPVSSSTHLPISEEWKAKFA